MNTPMHIHIVEAALDCLPGDCAAFWEPLRPAMKKASNYPDYFATGETDAEKNDQIDTDWREYVMIPAADNTVTHVIFDPLKLRQHSTMLNHWTAKIIENIKSGNGEKAAKFIGTLSHIIGDTGQAAHVFDERQLKPFLPQGNKPFVFHTTIEGISGKAEVSAYKPAMLGAGLDELNWRLLEELDILKQVNMAEVIPIIRAIMDGNGPEAEASASRTLTSCVKLFADVLFTIWNIVFSEKLKLDNELELQRLVPLNEHCDMLFNHGIMIDHIPGKIIDDALTLNLGGEDVHGIALLADMAPFFKEERRAFVEYSIPASVFEYFESEIGLNHHSLNETQAVFKVKLDDKTVFTSDTLGKDDPGVKIKIKLGNAKRLQLYVCDARPAPCDTKFFYPVFADPRLAERI